MDDIPEDDARPASDDDGEQEAVADDSHDSAVSADSADGADSEDTAGGDSADDVTDEAVTDGSVTDEAGAVEDGDDQTVAEPVDVRTAVLLLGSGELNCELAVSFQRLGAVVVAVDAAESHDIEAIGALIDRVKPRYVVAESGADAADVMIALAERGDVEVFPTPRSTRLGQDREGLRRLASDELGLPTAPFWFAGSAEELAAVAEHAGFPLVVRPVAGGPADGHSVLLRPADVEPAWQRAIVAGGFGSNRVMAETIVEVDYQITVLTVRTTGPSGPALHFCEPIGYNGHGDALEAWQPQPMSAVAQDAAKSIAARIVNSLGGRGVYSVELLVRGDEVYFADVRARPHDAGLVTLRSQRLSEFDLHARAILGVGVDTIMISPGAVQVVYPSEGGRRPAGSDRAAREAIAGALSVPESDVRLFEHPDARSPRRLGVALATGPNVAVARERARQVAAAVRRLP